MIGGVARRVGRSFAARPTGRDLRDLGVAVLLVGVVAGPFGLATGLLAWDPRPSGEIATLALVALFVPAIGEETVFRGALVPDRLEAPSATAAVVASTLLFVLWHLLEGWLVFPKMRELFWRPDFLAWAALIGFACAVLRRRSGSIWTAVALHWAAVMVWQGWLGGPSALRSA